MPEIGLHFYLALKFGVLFRVVGDKWHCKNPIESSGSNIFSFILVKNLAFPVTIKIPASSCFC